MSKLLNAFLPIVGMMGGGILAYHLFIQNKKDNDAYRAFVADLRDKGKEATQKEVWNAAIKYARKEDYKVRAQLDAAVKTLKRVAKLADVIDAQPKLERMLADPEPDLEVKRSILEYWMRKLEEALGIGVDPFAPKRLRFKLIFQHELDELYAAKDKLKRIQAVMETGDNSSC